MITITITMSVLCTSLEYGVHSKHRRTRINHLTTASFFGSAGDPSTDFCFYFYIFSWGLCFSSLLPLRPRNLISFYQIPRPWQWFSGPLHLLWHPHVLEVSVCLKHGRTSKASAGHSPRCTEQSAVRPRGRASTCTVIGGTGS